MSEALTHAESADRFEKWLKDFVMRKEIDVVVPTWPQTSDVLSVVSGRLANTKTFPVSAPDLVDALDNKWTCCEFMARLGIGIPASILVTPDDKHHPDRLDAIGFPTIVKTLYDSGSDGVYRVETAQEFYANCHPTGMGKPGRLSSRSSSVVWIRI